MKKMKRLVALALSVVMVLAMSVFAFADEAYTITIKNASEGHTYEAYQIFAGDLAEETKDGQTVKILSNIKWGTGVSEAGQNALGNAAKKAATLTDEASAAAFAKEVAKYLQAPKESTAANGEYTISGLDAGYYLVKDTDNDLNSSIDFHTAYIMEVVGNVEATPKGDVPSFEKKIKDINDSTDTTYGDWQDSADYDIGDQIPFKLEGTVASNYGDYKTYYFAFHDVEEKGLTFNADSVNVYVDGTKITDGYTVVTSPTDGCTFEVVFNDLKKIDSVKAGSKVTVEYTSKLNEKAVLGNQGNVNKAKLEFSNNPNNEQGGKGETPWDNVIVFTYKVVVNKVDQDNKALEGAEFTLSKKMEDGSLKEIAVVKNEAGTTFTFSGLDDGNYVLKETKTPDGYNTISDIEFTVTADHKIQWEKEERTDVLESLNGNKVSGEITFTSDKAEGSLETNIVNQKGSILPSTGGIGTTIFYVIGGILMVGAAVLLITKKRAEN